MPSTTMKDDTDLRHPPAGQSATSETATSVDHSGEWGLPLGGLSTPPAAAARAAAPNPPTSVVTLAPGAAQLRPVGSLGTRQEIQDELDRMAFAIRSFNLKQPDQIMREVAMYSARLTELAVLLHRVENLDRQYTRVRTQQVERWQHELELQFKI